MILKCVRPIWNIYGCQWKKYTPNPRFAIYHPSGTSDINNDLVLDQETRLVWERSPSNEKKDWDVAIIYSYTTVHANHKGWRLPTFEELLSLVDPTQTNPTLPVQHPFLNVQTDYFYWSSTLGMTSLPTYVWGYCFGNADTSNVLRTARCYTWLVRGGYGHDYPY